MNEQLRAFEPVLTKHLTPAPECISSHITNPCAGLFFFFLCFFFYVCPSPPTPHLFFFFFLLHVASAMAKTSRLSEVMLSSCWVPPRALNGLQTHPECLRRRAHTRTNTHTHFRTATSRCACASDGITSRGSSRSHRLMASGPRLKC